MQDYDQPTDAAKEAHAPANPLSVTGQRAIQGSDQPAADPMPYNQPAVDTMPNDQPSEFHGQTATTEFGDAMRAESGAEKPEVKHFHDIAEEGVYGEGRGGRG